MKRINKTWIALLLGALLMSFLVGAVWARPQSGPVIHDTASKLDRPKVVPKTHGTASKLDKPKSHHGGFHFTITIPGASFHPYEDGLDWHNEGRYIRLQSGTGIFVSPVPILPGNRTVESMTMYVEDDNGAQNACVDLYRTKTDGTETNMAGACSTGASGTVRSFSDTSISPNRIWGGHGAYLWLDIDGTDIKVHSVQIQYY